MKKGAFQRIHLLVIFELNEGFDLSNSSAVPRRGLEPPHLSAHPPQGCVYTNFTTWAYVKYSNPKNSITYNEKGAMQLLLRRLFLLALQERETLGLALLAGLPLEFPQRAIPLACR